MKNVWALEQRHSWYNSTSPACFSHYACWVVHQDQSFSPVTASQHTHILVTQGHYSVSALLTEDWLGYLKAGMHIFSPSIQAVLLLGHSPQWERIIGYCTRVRSTGIYVWTGIYYTSVLQEEGRTTSQKLVSFSCKMFDLDGWKAGGFGT